jgi:hypothetical protein
MKIRRIAKIGKKAWPQYCFWRASHSGGRKKIILVNCWHCHLLVVREEDPSCEDPTNQGRQRRSNKDAREAVQSHAGSLHALAEFGNLSNKSPCHVVAFWGSWRAGRFPCSSADGDCRPLSRSSMDEARRHSRCTSVSMALLYDRKRKELGSDNSSDLGNSGDSVSVYVRACTCVLSNLNSVRSLD